MSNLEMLYHNYDYNKSFSPSGTNYFEKEIKEGLPFFQQNKLQSTLRNNFFNTNNDTNIKMTSSEKNDMINLEAKKLIEREMNPYIILMKKEINLIIEKFNTELQEKNHNMNQLLNMRNELEEIKKTNEVITDDLRQKIIKNNNIFNQQEEKINSMQLNLNKLNQNYKMQLDNNNSVPNLINDIEKIKQDLNMQDMTIKKLISEQQINTEQSLLQKFNESNNKINNLKEENENLRKNIEDLNNNIRLMKLNDTEKKEQLLNQNNSNQELKNLIKQMQLELTNKENNIKNLEANLEAYKKKLDLINKNIETAFSNINTEHSSIITVATELKNIKKDVINFENLIENNLYKKDLLDIKFNEINEKFEGQNETFKEKNLKLNENINERSNKLSSDLFKKLEEYKKYFENNYDEIDGRISSINNQLSEVTTTLQTHPLLNMSNNEIITLKFKDEQMKTNNIFKKTMEEMRAEIIKLKKNINNEEKEKKNNLFLKQNFDKINNEINNIKQYPEYMNKIKQELNIRINLLQQQIPKENLENNKIDLEPLKILEKEVNRHSKEIKYLKEEKIPELLILIENSNLKNAGNGPNNFIKKEKEENGEINFGSRRIRNNKKSILNSINNIDTNNINKNNDENNDINNLNNDFNNNNSNNVINDVKKFMENKKKMNIREEDENQDENNNINNIDNFKEINNDINKIGNENEYDDFNSDFNENNNINVNRSNNNQSNFGLNSSSNNNNSREKDEAYKFMDEVLKNKDNDTINKSKQNLNNRQNDIEFDENFDDDDLNI